MPLGLDHACWRDRGYWEAKDTADDLDAEILKKRKKGYPLANTIFEDTSQAVLYQNKVEVERYDLTKTQGVADLFLQRVKNDTMRL